MKLVTVKLVRWNTHCLKKGHHAVTYGPAGGMGGEGYGSWLGRTRQGEISEIELLEDPFFEDVSALVKSMMAPSTDVDDATRDILGHICDPSPSGQAYIFTTKVLCPICGSEDVHCELDEPSPVEFKLVPRVTHSRWDSLDSQERIELVGRLLVDRGWITK